MCKGNFTKLFIIISVKYISQVEFQIIHIGADSTFTKVGNFQIHDMFVNFHVGNFFVSVKISENFGYLSHLYWT